MGVGEFVAAAAAATRQTGRQRGFARKGIEHSFPSLLPSLPRNSAGRRCAGGGPDSSYHASALQQDRVQADTAHTGHQHIVTQAQAQACAQACAQAWRLLLGEGCRVLGAGSDCAGSALNSQGYRPIADSSWEKKSAPTHLRIARPTRYAHTDHVACHLRAVLLTRPSCTPSQSLHSLLCCTLAACWRHRQGTCARSRFLQTPPTPCGPRLNR